ncbi:MAG TPA: HWE histidine kinase domain-containing protein [Allosphingosinicella sp.]|uniref:sensor histidine kinase n=1 Tax=Allosphingosinicella sp. TaxID=2823234 RepID=UPI002EDB6C88
MRSRIRAHDWAATPLGPMEQWPAALRLALNIAEHSAFPTAIYWGPELRLLYNDAWAPIPAERHPWALGRPAAEVWSDIWEVVGPEFRKVIETGEGMSAFEQMLPMVRDGVPHETYWNYSFTPIVDETGKVAGIFNQGNEVTQAVTNERRLSFQVALSERLRSISSPEQVKMEAASMLGAHLSIDRAGYGEIDPAGQQVIVRRDWTRGEHMPSLAGESRIMDAFGPAVIDTLRAGETLVIEDYREDARVTTPEHYATWEGINTRSLIVVPLLRVGKLRALFYLHAAEPRRWAPWEIALARDVADSTWAAVERAEVELRLRASEDHYRHAVELNPQVSWTSLPDGQLNRVSRRWLDWTGTPGTGESWAEGLHPDDRQRTFEAWGHCIATGDPYDIVHRVKMRDGSYRWARSRAYPRRDEKGEIVLWYGATEDIHEQKVAEEHQRLLINELNHRVKNTLATVQAIAFQTLKGNISLTEARSRFEARLLALSNAHNLLTEQNWEGAPLHRVVADSIAPLAGERTRIDMEGAAIWLAPRAALALALALHELSTNAIKYGALSNDGGRVSISWRTEGDTLRFEWKERDGPPVEAPVGRGFGSRLIERGLAADLGGTATLHFEPDGLCCVIEASLEAIQAREAELG